MASDIPAVITVTQRFSRKALTYLRETPSLAHSAGTLALLETLHRNRKKGQMECTQSITYKVKPHGFGRYYGAKGSLEQLQSECRATLCSEYYHDVDIVNAQPVLLAQLAEYIAFDAPQLDNYVANRETVLAEVMAEMHCSREDAKEAVLKVVYGGGSEYEGLASLRLELREFVKKLRGLAANAELWAIAEKKAKNDDKGVYGVFLSMVAQTAERACMVAMKTAFESRGWVVGVLAYDGVMVERRKGETITAELLLAVQAEVERVTRWKVQVVEKTMAGFTVPPADSLADDVIVDDSYAATKFVELLGDDCKRQDGTIHLFNPETGLWQVATEEVYLAAIHRVRSQLIFTQRAPDGTKRITNYGGDTKKARLMISQLAALIPNTNYLRDRGKSSLGHLLYSDGIFNMKTKTFTEGFDREIVFTTRVNRPFCKARDETVIALVLRTLFITPFTDAAVGTWYMNRLARALAGHTEDKAFYCLLGEPNTGKSTVTTLLSRTFDGYVRTWNLDNLKFKAGSTTDEAKRLSWVADLLSARIALSNEARMDGVALDGNLIKRLSGGDALQLRRNFQDEQNCELMTTFFTLSNDLPAVSPCDAALRVRMNHARFNYSFVAKSADDCGEWERPADSSLKASIESEAWRDAFTWIILDAYGDGTLVPTPDCVKVETDEHIPVDTQSIKTILEETYELVGAAAGEDDWVSSRAIIQTLKGSGLNLSDTKIGRELSKLGLTKTDKKISGKTIRIWKGIRE